MISMSLVNDEYEFDFVLSEFTKVCKLSNFFTNLIRCSELNFISLRIDVYCKNRWSLSAMLHISIWIEPCASGPDPKPFQIDTIFLRFKRHFHSHVEKIAPIILWINYYWNEWNRMDWFCAVEGFVMTSTLQMAVLRSMYVIRMISRKKCCKCQY